jgi:hypothetical protein
MFNQFGFAYILTISFACINTISARAQDERIQYPLPLQKSFFGINVGSLAYPFSNIALPAEYSVEKISTPGEAVRITLFGYHFTKNLSARITYICDR